MAEGLPVLSLLLSSRPLLPKLVLTLLSPCWVPLLRLWASWDRSMTGNRQAPRKSRAPAPRHRHHHCRRLPTGSPLGQSHPRYHRGAEGAESVLWGQNWRPALNSLWPCQLQDPEVQKHATQILRKMLQQEEAELQVWVETPVGLCRALPKKLGLGSLQGQSLSPTPRPFGFPDRVAASGSSKAAERLAVVSQGKEPFGRPPILFPNKPMTPHPFPAFSSAMLRDLQSESRFFA